MIFLLQTKAGTGMFRLFIIVRYKMIILLVQLHLVQLL